MLSLLQQSFRKNAAKNQHSRHDDPSFSYLFKLEGKHDAACPADRKREKAKKIIADYEQDLKETKTKINDKAKDSKALVIRIRQGNIYIYPEQVYFNSTLYGDLGLKAPNEVKAAKAQELISLEKLSEMNPDHIFVQFSDDENADKPDALKDLEKIQSGKALKQSKKTMCMSTQWTLSHKAAQLGAKSVS